MMKLGSLESEKALSLGQAGVDSTETPCGSRTLCLSSMQLKNVSLGPWFDETIGMCSRKSNPETLAKELAANSTSCPAVV